LTDFFVALGCHLRLRAFSEAEGPQPITRHDPSSGSSGEILAAEIMAGKPPARKAVLQRSR
jgi:hypothetical protein